MDLPNSTSVIMVAMILIAMGGVSFGGTPYAEFSPHQSAVLDSTITFTAKIINADQDKYIIYWSELRWGTKMEPRTTTAEMTDKNQFRSDWVLEYPEDVFHVGNYSLIANIVYKSGQVPVEFTTQLLGFTLTENFTGKVSVNKVINDNTSMPYLVSISNETEVRVKVDSHRILKKATSLSWSWFNVTTPIGNTPGPMLKYNFTQPQSYQITAKLEAVFNHTVKRNETIVKTGNFTVNIIATEKVERIENVNVSVSTWYKNGENGGLLDIQINCDGKGPFRYCIMIKELSYHSRGNESCHDAKIETISECKITLMSPVDTGQHKVIILLDNDWDSYVTQLNIDVKSQTIVLPLVFQLVVPIVIVLLLLVSLSCLFKSKSGSFIGVYYK